MLSMRLGDHTFMIGDSMIEAMALPQEVARVVLSFLKRVGPGNFLQDSAGNYLLSVVVMKELIEKFGLELTDQIGLTPSELPTG